MLYRLSIIIIVFNVNFFKIRRKEYTRPPLNSRQFYGIMFATNIRKKKCFCD